MLLSIAYFPPISYFVMMAKGMKFTADGIIPSAVTLEACETYRKQTWRNRCRICSASGPEYLNFPIVHENGHELPIREIKVDYSTPWVVRTQRTISSAYDSSAYFAYYKDELFSIGYLQNYEFWVAQYYHRPTWPYRFSVWQYTEKGQIEGIEKPLDFDLMLVKKTD